MLLKKSNSGVKQVNASRTPPLREYRRDRGKAGEADPTNITFAKHIAANLKRS